MEQRKPPQRRKRRKVSPLQKFIYQYFPSICLVGLSILCVSMVIFTIQTISSIAQGPVSGEMDSPVETTDGVDEALQEQINAILSQAEKLANEYDYLSAIDLLKTFPDYETTQAITDQIDLSGIIGSVIGTVQVMEPLGKIVGGADLRTLPDTVPRLKGLVFAGHKTPVVATDLLQPEQGEQFLHGVTKATAQPFGAENRAVVGIF